MAERKNIMKEIYKNKIEGIVSKIEGEYTASLRYQDGSTPEAILLPESGRCVMKEDLRKFLTFIASRGEEGDGELPIFTSYQFSGKKTDGLPYRGSAKDGFLYENRWSLPIGPYGYIVEKTETEKEVESTMYVKGRKVITNVEITLTNPFELFEYSDIKKVEEVVMKVAGKRFGITITNCAIMFAISKNDYRGAAKILYNMISSGTVEDIQKFHVSNVCGAPNEYDFSTRNPMYDAIVHEYSKSYYAMFASEIGTKSTSIRGRWDFISDVLEPIWTYFLFQCKGKNEKKKSKTNSEKRDTLYNIYKDNSYGIVSKFISRFTGNELFRKRYYDMYTSLGLYKLKNISKEMVDSVCKEMSSVGDIALSSKSSITKEFINPSRKNSYRRMTQNDISKYIFDNEEESAERKLQIVEDIARAINDMSITIRSASRIDINGICEDLKYSGYDSEKFVDLLSDKARSALLGSILME